MSKGIFGALAVAALAGFGGAMATAENYCEPFDDTQCVVLEQGIEDTCCIQTGSGRQLATCSRDLYFCLDGEGGGTVWGPAYNCQTPGPACE